MPEEVDKVSQTPDTPPPDPMAEMMTMIRGLSARLDSVMAENVALKASAEAQIASTPQQGGTGYWGSRAARSVVLPTRPVQEDPDNLQWVGRVAKTNSTRGE